MAQSQVQGREVSAGDVGRKNMPARRMQDRQLASRDSSQMASGPFGVMRRLSDDIDQLFGQLLGATGNAGRVGLSLANPLILAPVVDWLPTLEILESNGKLVVQTDLPGVAAEDVSIEVTDGLLTISGERREEREAEDDGVRRTERRYGRFARSVALPEGARAEDIQASFHDGVLEITIPVQQRTPRRIAIDTQNAPRKESDGARASAGTESGGSARRSTGADAAASRAEANSDSTRAGA